MAADENKINIPEIYTAKLYVCVGVGTSNFGNIKADEYNLSNLFKDDFERHGYILLKEVDIKINLKGMEITEEKVLKIVVDNLKQQKKDVELNANKKMQDIQDKIDQYLAIEYRPEKPLD